MKKILLFSLLASVTFLFSCQKGSIDKNNKKNIVGTWVPQTERDQVYLNGNIVKDTTINFNPANNPSFINLVFRNDGSGAYVNAASDSVTTSFTYKVNVSQLALTISGNTSYYTILGTTGTSLGIQAAFAGYPDASTGLDPNTIYNFVVATYYNRK